MNDRKKELEQMITETRDKLNKLLVANYEITDEIMKLNIELDNLIAEYYKCK